MGDSFQAIRAAVVQAAPCLFDREATVAKACALTAQAAAQGARLILFPEAYIPAYPRGLSFGAVVGGRSAEGRQLWERYWANAVDVPDEDLQGLPYPGIECQNSAERLGCLSTGAQPAKPSAVAALGAAARAARAYLAIGVIERDTATSRGTLYCTVLYFGPDGRLLGKHRKLKPTASERLIWGEGDGSTLTVLDTAVGKLGGLICWENYMPLARMALYQKGVELYLAPTADSRESWQATLRHIAVEGRCFVLGCNQFVTKAMYPGDLPGLSELAEQPEIMCRGGSAIVSPMGEYLAGPLFDAEGILLADLDTAELTRARFDLDVTGHYARPDIFHLTVDEQPRG